MIGGLSVKRWPFHAGADQLHDIGKALQVSSFDATKSGSPKRLRSAGICKAMRRARPDTCQIPCQKSGVIRALRLQIKQRGNSHAPNENRPPDTKDRRGVAPKYQQSVLKICFPLYLVRLYFRIVILSILKYMEIKFQFRRASSLFLSVLESVRKKRTRLRRF